jgi:hypothetical protein
VRVAELLLEDVKAFRLFERREVFALDVLDQRDLELLAVVDVELDRRDLVETSHRGRAVAALAGDDLVAVRRDRPDQDRLEHALLANARRQLLDVAELRARLLGVRLDELQRQHLPDVPSGAARELLDVVRVVAHAGAVGESAFSHWVVPRQTRASTSSDKL